MQVVLTTARCFCFGVDAEYCLRYALKMRELESELLAATLEDQETLINRVNYYKKMVCFFSSNVKGEASRENLCKGYESLVCVVCTDFGERRGR